MELFSSMLFQKFRSLWATFLLAVFCSGAYGNAFKLDLEVADQLSPLTPGKGYALFYINTSDIAPSIFFQPLNPNSPIESPTLWGERVYQLDLTNHEKQFYVVQLLPADYQIKRVETPLYDFSYKMTTKTDKLWRFRVVPGKVNFVGELRIATQNTKKALEVALINRFALHNEAINQQFASTISQYPLVSAFFYRDDFHALMNDTPATDALTKTQIEPQTKLQSESSTVKEVQ